MNGIQEVDGSIPFSSTFLFCYKEDEAGGAVEESMNLNRTMRRKMAARGTYKLSVLFFREERVWVGQCLQHNIAVQGENLRECMRALRAVLLTRIAVAAKLKMDHPFGNVPKAPAKYWKQYQDAVELKSHLDETAFQFPEGTPSAFMIQPSDLELRVC